MSPVQFCYWLLGYFELTGDSKLTKKQAEMVKDKLESVYTYEDEPPNLPEMPDILK